MEWSRVSILQPDSKGPGILDLSAITGGLDTDASLSHREFMSDISHFTEDMERHSGSTKPELRPTMDSRGGFDSIISFEEGVSLLGAEALGSGLEIPLSNSIKDEVTLEKADLGTGQAIRLVAPEGFGGRMSSFMLPHGAKIGEVYWNRDKLKIDLEF